MFCQFLSDDRVIVPEDESIVRCLVLGDAEFSVDVILHTMVVAIKMVRSDVHQYGDVRTEVIHIIQLERAKFDNIVIVVIFGYLQSKAFADVACQTYVQTCAFENMVDQEVVVVFPLEPVIQIILASVWRPANSISEITGVP